MIHEVILSLIGQTGDIIILMDKKRKKTGNENNINIDEYGFEVNNNIHIFLSSEIKIINEIVELGYYFYIINIFCLLVKKNTVYKNLTHIHKFNKLNNKKKKKKKKKKKESTSERPHGNDNSSRTASSSNSSSSPFSSSTYDSASSGEESDDSINLSNSYKKRKYEKKNEIDDYFGVILRNIKSINNVSPYGYYANGICNEVNKFMKRYLKKISEIEEYINNNSNTPLTHILTMLEKKREEIIIIINIIKNYLEFQKKEEQNVIEGESRNKTKEILDYLYENCLSGNSRIKNVYHKYFKNLGKILLNQILSWMLYGQLLDPYYEFFIQKRQFIYSDDKKIFLSPEELYENLTLTNVQSLNFEWNYLFFQTVSNLPDCCIDKAAGRKILFIGKSIRILIRSNRWNTNDIIKLFSITKMLSKAFDETPSDHIKKGASYYVDSTTTYENDTSNECVTNNATRGGIYNQCNTKNGIGLGPYSDDYVRSFYISSSDTSSTSSSSYENSSDSKNEMMTLYCKEIFDITIEKIRSIIAYKLWKYIVKDINLIKIFDLFKDIYLLNNGDFYDYFLEKSWSIMHTPPNYKNEILLKILAWKNSALSVEDYCRSKYENAHDKLILEKYENSILSQYNNIEGECNFFSDISGYHFEEDVSENIISKYFYPRISYKKFSYDSFEIEKYDNLILGGMSYIYDNKIVLNDFYKGIQTLFRRKYYDYDNVFSVCINSYRQQILRGFKHGFDFSVNFNNFFDNKFVHAGGKEVGVEGGTQVGTKVGSQLDVEGGIDGMDIPTSSTHHTESKDNFLVGCCFALVIHSVRNPLLYKTDVLNGSLGYWGALGDCLSVEIRVKFYEKKNNGEDNLSEHKSKETVEYANSLNSVILGDVEVEVSLYIGGKGISAFVQNSNSYTVDYTKESIWNNKLLAGSINQEKEKLYDYVENKENYVKRRNINSAMERDKENVEDENIDENNNKSTKLPVLKIQSNKQTFHNINKNSLTKFRVRINCIKHSFSVYIQKLDEYNLYINNPKNKIKPIIHIRALDMTQAFTLDIGNGYIGFYTCPILFKHKLLKKKSKLNEWFKRFYDDTLNTNSVIYRKNFFDNMDDQKRKEMINNEIKNVNKMVLYDNRGIDNRRENDNREEKKESDSFGFFKNNKIYGKNKEENLLLFSSYDCSVEIYKWFHQSYKSPLEIPEIDIENETLIFYDKQINKNIKIHSGLNLWNNMEIHFKLTWPIALIINTNTVYTYNSIFQFLFLLSRIYYNLKILCYHNRHLYKYLNYRKGTLLFSYLFSIRYKMQFFIFHLIKYLQEDIINYEYRLMITQIHKSKDFEYTKSIHDLYISQVATKCFLRVQDLTNPLMELVDTSFKFCYFFQCLIENELFTDILNYEMNNEEGRKRGDAKSVGDDSKEDPNEEEKDNDLNQVIEKLLQYNDTFNEKLVIVMNEMVNISSHSNHAYLVHLLTILDFNHYISKIKDSRPKAQEIIEQKKDGDESGAANLHRDKVLEKDSIMKNNNIQFSKRDDDKMEYTDIENIHIGDNYYHDKKEIYTNNILNGVNLSINSMSQNFTKINNLDDKNNFVKNRIVNKFGNLLYSNVDEKCNIQQIGTTAQAINTAFPGNANVGSDITGARGYDYGCYYNGSGGGSTGGTYSHGGYNNGYNNYNLLIDKYSNILNSHMNSSNNSNAVYSSPQDYATNPHSYSYKSVLDTTRLKHLNAISNAPEGNNNSSNKVSSLNMYSADAGLKSYSDLFGYQNNSLAKDIANNSANDVSRICSVSGIHEFSGISSVKQNVGLDNNKISTGQIALNVSNSIDNNATAPFSSLIDIDVKNTFNVQNLLNNYNYSYDGLHDNNSFGAHHLNQLGNNASQMYNNMSNAPNYGNISLNIYQNETNNVNEMDREKKQKR
ncbi:conserved Plasmodium protein, unknown function [Plasmodium ovale wallikeri]|uniref:Gamma-tubulin complex component n=2 Tax=Plasmodium ovale TaxID=36330 RepID=A0A1C3KWC5_PLAOA|nr:conserved Plasmodium protein, unknown function [Plasmodium ovale wallikeri]SBT78498.1 conserved Plasmodium protein, unknown function [Plasmodium ovale]